MSSVHIARLFLLVITLSTVALSYSVIAAGGAGDEPSGVRHHWRPVYERSEFSDGMAPSYGDEGRNKRGMDEEDTQLSKRTNLKRLVILSARGFGKK